MTTAVKSKNVDLDAIFDPYVQGTSPGLTGIEFAGADIHTRYAPLPYGAQAAATGITCKVGGAGSFVDLNTLFAAIGTANYSLPIDGQTFNGFSSGNISAAMTGRVTVNVSNDGTYSVTCLGNQTATTTALGTWLPSGGTVSQYQVQFTVTQLTQETDGPATISNTAAGYTACTTNQSASVSAAVGQHTGLSQGGTYTIAISIKNISSGAVSTSTISANVASSGSA